MGAQVFLTFHGGSGTDDEELRNGIAAGINIVPHQWQGPTTIWPWRVSQRRRKIAPIWLHLALGSP